MTGEPKLQGHGFYQQAIADRIAAPPMCLATDAFAYFEYLLPEVLVLTKSQQVIDAVLVTKHRRRCDKHNNIKNITG